MNRSTSPPKPSADRLRRPKLRFGFFASVPRRRLRGFRLRRAKRCFAFCASAHAELTRLEDTLNDLVDRLAAMRVTVFGE